MKLVQLISVVRLLIIWHRFLRSLLQVERTFKMATSCHIYKETLQEELGKGRSCFALCFVYCFIMRNSFCLTWPAKTLGKFAVYIAVCCRLYWCVLVCVVVCVCVLFWPVWSTSPCCFALPLHLTCVLLPLFHCPFALIKRGAQVCPCPAPLELCMPLCALFNVM